MKQKRWHKPVSYTHLDVYKRQLLLCSEEIQPLTLVRTYPIGVITMMDGGKRDEKIIGIPYSDPTYNGYADIDQLPKHIFEEMQHFFSVYKELEGKTTVVDDVQGAAEAVRIIEACIKNYARVFDGA